jgi:chromosome segregation ATPase
MEEKSKAVAELRAVCETHTREREGHEQTIKGLKKEVKQLTASHAEVTEALHQARNTPDRTMLEQVKSMETQVIELQDTVAKRDRELQDVRERSETKERRKIGDLEGQVQDLTKAIADINLTLNDKNAQIAELKT